jgi:hypothetical protein
MYSAEVCRRIWNVVSRSSSKPPLEVWQDGGRVFPHRGAWNWRCDRPPYQPYPVVKEDQVCEGVLTGGRPVDDALTLCSLWRDLRAHIHNRIPG